MALTLGTLVAYLDVNDAQFKSKLAAADAEFKGSADRMTAAGVKQAAAFNSLVKGATVGAVAGAAAIGLSLHSYEDFVIQVEKLSKQTNMSTEGTSQFLGQLQLLHVNSSTAGIAIKTMEKAMYGLETGAKAPTAAFKILGLTWNDLKDLSPEDQIARIRDMLSRVVDPAARAAAAQTLLGRGAKDMVLWYTAADGTMQKVNQTLKENGQIIGEKQVQDAAKAAASWQVFTGALKGLQYVIAQSALPWLTRLLNAVTGIVRALRPFAPLLMPLTIALGAFVGVVKTAVFLQKAWGVAIGLWTLTVNIAKAAQIAYAVATGATSLAEVRAALSTKAVTVATEGRTIATEAGTVATEGGTAATTAGSAALGIYAALIVGIIADIYLLVKAYGAWKSAEAAIQQEMAQAKGESSTASSAQKKIDAWKAAHPGQRLPASYQKLQDYVNTAQNEAQGNVGRNWLKNLPGNLLTGKGLKLAGGGDFITQGPTPILAGEAGPEHVRVTPLGKGGGDVHIHIGQVIGTDSASARAFAGTVANLVMAKQRQLVATGF